MVVGLTGGIGSGKSMVAMIWQFLGVPVYNSDIQAKKLYHTNSFLKNSLIQRYGSEIYQREKLNTQFLASIVFDNKTELEWLNALVHPLVQQDFESWQTRQNSAYVLKEAAILIESGGAQYCNQIVVVTAPVDLRIQRVMQRDQVSKEEVLKRMDKQMADENRLKFAHFEIVNDQKHSLITQIVEIHKKLTKKLTHE